MVTPLFPDAMGVGDWKGWASLQGKESSGTAVS